MFPPAPGYKWTPLTPIPLTEPVEMEFVFVDGPFDGHKSTATVRAEMSERFTVTMKKDGKRYLYRYARENTFKYESEVE